MVPVNVTVHAIERYVERIGGDQDEAVAVLTGPAVHLAAQFGARVVRIPNGRVLMKFTAGAAFITTVVPLTHLPIQLIPHAWGGPPPSHAQLSHLQKDAS